MPGENTRSVRSSPTSTSLHFYLYLRLPPAVADAATVFVRCAVECMVKPHKVRSACAVIIQRAYRHKRAMERWEVARELLPKWRRATRLQKVYRGRMGRQALRRVSAPAAHRVLRVLKKSGLSPWTIWPVYARSGLTYDRFLDLAVLPANQLGGEVLLTDSADIITAGEWQEGWPRIAWGIAAADRYRMSTVLREERSAWERTKRTRGRFLQGLDLDRRRVYATQIQAIYRSHSCRMRLREFAEDTAAQTRDLFEGLGLGRHVERLLRFGVGYEKLLFGDAGPPSGNAIRDDQLGAERSWVTDSMPMAAWGLDAAERQRLLGAMPVARSRWTRLRKLIVYQAQRVKRKYATLEAKALAVFNEIDTDGSGTINQDEFKKLCVSLGIGMGPKQLKVSTTGRTSLTIARLTSLIWLSEQECFRWMDKGKTGRITRGTVDLDGVIDFGEFFSWWRANRDGTSSKGLLAGGGFSQQAAADGVSTKKQAQSRSISAFAGLFAEGESEADFRHTGRPLTPAPIRDKNGALKLLSGKQRMEEEARKIRPVSGVTRKVSRAIQAGSARSRFTRGVAAGSGTAVAMSNACTLAFMENKGRGLKWEQIEDISAEGAKWTTPTRQGHTATLGEWLGGADPTRARHRAGDTIDAIPESAKLKVGRLVRVLWEETARAAVERCCAITTGWTPARAARCGHEGVVGQIDADGTCRVHFLPAHNVQVSKDDLASSVASGNEEGPAVLVALHDYIVDQKVQVVDLFERIDHDGSGELDLDEFCAAVSMMRFTMPASTDANSGAGTGGGERHPPTLEQIQAAFHVLDYDGSGLVDAAEFLVAVKAQKRLVIGRLKQRLAVAVESRASVPVLTDLIRQAEAAGIASDDEDLAAAKALRDVSGQFLHGDAGFGSGVIMVVQAAAAAARKVKEEEAEAAAVAARIATKEAVREEVHWFPIDAVEVVPTEDAEEKAKERRRAQEAAEQRMAKRSVSRVVGYEVTGCVRSELNGSYDAAGYKRQVDGAPAFKHVSGEYWLYWQAVAGSAHGGQWFLGRAVPRVKEQSQPGGTKLAFIVGDKTKPAPRVGWYISTIPSGNGGYKVDTKMVMRPLLADDGAVLPANEVADQKTVDLWVKIGAETRREAQQTLRRYAQLSRPLDENSIGALELCRNRLRLAGEVSQSFGDASGWAAALNLQAECCASLGKDRLVGALKLRARAVTEASAPPLFQREEFERPSFGEYQTGRNQGEPQSESEGEELALPPVLPVDRSGRPSTAPSVQVTTRYRSGPGRLGRRFTRPGTAKAYKSMPGAHTVLFS